MNGPLRMRGRWSTMTADDRADLLERGKAAIFDPALRTGVLEIIEDVRANGDEALVRALAKFDKVDVTPDRLRVSAEEFAAARRQIDDGLLTAIRDGIAHIRAFNTELLARHGDWSFETEPGVVVGEKTSPIASAGLFVPSGKGSFPSVLVQLGTPAIVAGVPTIAVVVPPKPGTNGAVDPAVLVVADELGLHDVFRSNGPAGIAALAFGTRTVPKVHKVTGPGSPPVTCAQIEVQRFGTASVMLLGPSESLILADGSADPYLLAADVLNEAEHGPDSSSVLVTDSPALLAAVQIEIEKQLADLPADRAGYARKAMVNGGAVLVDDLAQGAEVTNAYAPEHMQLVAEDEQGVLAQLHDAGEILLGQSTTVSMANFVLGCPAALPTSGYAKVAGGVTVTAFRKSSAVARSNRAGLERMAATVTSFCAHEGFPAHAAAVTRRLNR